MRKQITLVLAVVVPLLLGCGPRPGPRLAEQTATGPSSTVASSSPQTDFDCGSLPTSCKNSHLFNSRRTIIHRSKAHEVNGVGWLCSDTGKSPTQYCVEEGGSIRFSDGHLVKGPAKGTYKGK